MKTLVTGGAGFIGSHLCETFLRRGDTVFCVDNLSTGALANVEHLSEIYKGQFKVLTQSVQELGSFYVDRIFHLASPASPVFYNRFPIETLEANVIGTKKVLDLALKTKARVLFTSTSEIYGDPEVHPQVETYNGNVDPNGLRACYDESKRCGETLCSIYRRLFGLDVRVVRIFNTYGPRMREDDGRVVSNFILQALWNKPITLYGDGSQTRSFQYIEDLIEGLTRTMLKTEVESPINLGREEEVSILTLASMIIELTGSKSEIVFESLPEGDPCKRKPNTERARECLGWQSQTSLRNGLVKTIDHFLKRNSK